MVQWEVLPSHHFRNPDLNPRLGQCGISEHGFLQSLRVPPKKQPVAGLATLGVNVCACGLVSHLGCIPGFVPSVNQWHGFRRLDETVETVETHGEEIYTNDKLYKKFCFEGWLLVNCILFWVS